MNVKHQNLNIIVLFEQWQSEFQTNGIIENEAIILQLLKTEELPLSSKQLSEVYTMLALTRLKKGSDDAIVRIWIDKAMQLDPQNDKAKSYIIQYQWIKWEDIFNSLHFPPIRETDNRPAKKKIAEQYIETCRKLLEIVEEMSEELEKGFKAAEKLENQNLINTYESLLEIHTEAEETAVQLLKATEEYEQSITGVFYTSTHYEQLKTKLDYLFVLKENWKNVFKDANIETNKADLTALTELNEMVGLQSVKRRVHDFYRFLKYQKNRKQLGFQTKDEQSLNMILTGNPGTGKTTIARLLAKIYYELGVLPSKEVIEADRSQLVGAFVGQTEENVRAIVDKAVGGVLFIDEAYSLKREGQSGNDYGQTAIDTLVSLISSKEYAGKFAVILAGYPEEMRQFLDANPGLRSRFPQSNSIQLPDYTPKELLEIADKLAIENDYLLTDGAKRELEKRIEQEQVDDTFGNARTVRNIVLDAIFHKGSTSSEDTSLISYTLLDEDDFLIESIDDSVPPKQKLAQLIGLSEVKDDVAALVSFVRLQQFRREQGLPIVPIQLHSVFTGNPGTGKTTVAKIYAELLKECGMLKRGHLIISSRSDFVAGYVGQTAIKTKKKIREALGGVLFIDEAYSLLSQSSGDFGKEVIDTLVDEMTKHNENLVVVLAGYPKEMEQLLESNPGLKSRFKKFFNFPDYNSEEILEIMIHYASDFQYDLTEHAQQYLRDLLNTVSIEGNGRFATNVIDDSIQVQALRLMSQNNQQNLLENASILTKEDIETAIHRGNLIKK